MTSNPASDCSPAPLRCALLRPKSVNRGCGHSYVCNYSSINKPQTIVTNDLLMVFSRPRVYHAWISSRVFSLCGHLFIQRNKYPHHMSIKNNYITPCQNTRAMYSLPWQIIFHNSYLPRCDGNRGSSEADTRVWQECPGTVKGRAGTSSSRPFTSVGEVPKASWLHLGKTTVPLPESPQRIPALTWNNRPLWFFPTSVPYSLTTFKKHGPGSSCWHFLQAPGHSSLSTLQVSRCIFRLEHTAPTHASLLQLHRNHFLLKHHFRHQATI